jgi:hypothetical protein
MVNPRRAEIFALPHPLDAMDDARDNFHSSVRRCSSVVEQRIRNARVVGSIPTTGFPNSPWQAVEKRLRRSQIFIAPDPKTGTAPEERHVVRNHLIATPNGAIRVYLTLAIKISLPLS